MKGAVIALLCAAALAQAELNENGCPINPYVDVLKPHPNCNKYYQCAQGELLERKCASDLVFDVETQFCDWPDNVNCGDRIIGGENDGGDSGSTDDVNGDSDNGDSGNGGNSDPSQAREICAAEESDGVLVAHENCNQFYKCSGGKPVALDCWGNLLFNPANNQCDWPDNVNCGDRVIGGGNGDQDGGNGEGGNGDGDDGNNGNGGNSDPSQAREICAAEESDGVLVAHENCNQFYKCSGGKPVALDCWGNLLFNPANNQCDWPDNVNCGDRVIGGGNGDQDGGNEDGGNGDSDNGGSGNEDGGNGEGGNGGNSDPSEAAKICAAEGSDGVLVAHENCNQFYNCDGGKPIALNCGGNLLFNPATNQCDWPDNVNCGDRVIGGGNGDQDGGNDNGGNGDGEDGSNGNGGNSDPSQAPKICATEGSDGVLVAHEKCNLFYVCDAGTPVVRECWGNLFFNPANNQCDWPDVVNCGDRVIGGGNSGEDGGNEGGDNGDSDHGNGGDEDNGNDDGGNGGGHDDPSKAEEICAAENDDDVLVAHEDCNKFYQCKGGKPVVRVCYGELYFNPSTDTCDWSHNVNCGSRHIKSAVSFNKHNRHAIRV